jgi:hypothetical protein
MNLIRPSFDRIRKYIEELNFLAPIMRGIQRVLLVNRGPRAARMVSIRADVDAVVAYLQSKLGSTWAAVSVPRAPRASLLVNPPASVRPWESVARMRGNPAFAAWVRGHLVDKVTWM